MSPSNQQRLLISFAHPDDESFGMGGAIAKYAEKGVDIYLICSTNGDAGTVDDGMLADYGSIGELRLAELACAANKLGIKEVIPFGYHDSGMMGSPDNQNPNCLFQANDDVVTEKIVREIRRIRPQVVVTFDAYGGYGHPDHIVMHRTTTRAFYEAGDPAKYPEQGLEPYQPAKLYYSSFPRLSLRLWIWEMRLRGQNPRQLGRNKDLDLVEALHRQMPIHALVDVSPYQKTWDEASECHASQQNPRRTTGLSDRIRRLIYRKQEFTRAYPVPNGRRKERDLFEGILG